MHAGFGAEFGEKVICMSFKSNHSKMFLGNKAITIGNSHWKNIITANYFFVGIR